MGPVDIGFGFTGDFYLLAYACMKPGELEGINCEDPLYDDYAFTSLDGQRSPLLPFGSSGFGTSVLWTATPFLGLELSTATNWDADYSLFYWLFISAHLSFG